MAGSHSHRSSQTGGHKPFKSKHSSKGALKAQNKGKVERTKANNKAIKTISKVERKNVAMQIKHNKILNATLSRKLFEGSNATAKVVTVISLTSDISAASIAAQLVNGAKEDPEEDDMMFEAPSITDVKIKRFKANLRVILPDPSNFLNVLDSAKISDFVVFGFSATEEIDPKHGEQILRALESQGIASVMGVIPNLVTAYPKKNLQKDIYQSLFSFFKHFFPNQDKLFALDSPQDSINCTRTLCQKFPNKISWRDSRGYMLADAVYWKADETNPDEGHLVIEGTARGIGFNANRLVHIPGHGDFQLHQLEKLAKSHSGTAAAESVHQPDENQEGLDELAPEEVDMDAEWESEEEDHVNARGVRMDSHVYLPDTYDRSLPKRVPKGTSDYQAKWYLDDSILSDEESEEEMEAEMETEMEAEAEEEPMDYDDAKSEMFVELSPEEEELQFSKYRELIEEDREFPDEIELDPHESAIERLARYRGIKSLGNCQWDYEENHDPKKPLELNRLLAITNFKATRNKVLKEAIIEAEVVAGSKCRMYIKAPRFLVDSVVDPAEKAFIVYGLLEHEHKLAMVNFHMKPWEEATEPLKAKSSIIVQYGPRRQVIQPVFSQNSNNANNVTKYEKFLHPENTTGCIATCIAPVTFASSVPAIFFKQDGATGAIELIGSGTFLNADNKRIMAKRVVLTGHPVKIHKRMITIRYMFFNNEDVNYFKAIPLFTKMGRTGFIKESLGTHGYMKATFDGKLNPQDTIGMAMYKRVWPKPSIMWSA